MIEFKKNDNVKDLLNTICGKVMLDGDSYDVLVGKRTQVEDHEGRSRVRTRRHNKEKDGAISQEEEPSKHRDKQGKKYQE